MELHKQFYTYLIYFSYVLQVVIYFGIANFDPKIMQNIMSIIKLYISVYLMYKFNPFTRDKITFDTFEKKLIFSSAIYLFLSTSFANNYLKFIKI